MADKRLFFTVGADVGPGSKAFDKLAKDAKKSMGDVDSSLDETESAGKRLASALEAQFESIDSAMTETKAAADTLAAALGPELAGKIDTAAVVQEFQRLGLTLDEIQADADALASALKKADDVSLRHMTGETDRARVATDELGRSAGSSKSVLANMVGNSVQDVGELTGVAGSAGVAIGQMGEYMADARADGDSLSQILRNFGKVAVPIGAIVVATSALASIFQQAGDRAKRAAEQVSAFTGALGDADSASDAVRGLADQLERFDADARTAWGGFVEGVARAVKAIPVLGGAIGDAGQNVSDVIPVFNQLEISADDIGEAAARGGSAWDDLQVSLWAAKEAGQITAAEYKAASQVLDEYRASTEKAAEVNRFLVGSEEDLLQAYVAASGEAVRVAAATDGVAESSTEAADATDRLRRRTDELNLRWQALQGTLDEDSAFLSIQNQFAAVKSSGEAAWIAAAEGAADAGDKARNYQGDVIRLKEQIVQYGQQIGLLPRQVETYLSVLDRGDIAEMERRLAILTRNRDVSVRIQSLGGAGYGALTGARAAGGTVYGSGETAVVGENGPEIVRLPQGAHVYRNSESRAMVGDAGPGAAVYNVTINQLPGQRPSDIVDALKKYERRNGTGWRR